MLSVPDIEIAENRRAGAIKSAGNIVAAHVLTI